jgi:hypothetical protein
MCIFAVPFRNACFLCHALEFLMISRLVKLKGSRPRPDYRRPGCQNDFAAFPGTSSRETPISSSRRSSSEFRSCHPCRRINQVSMLRTHVESPFRPVRAAALARGASITDDCDIPNAPFLLAGRRHSQGVNLIKPGMPCQQSINSLPCPSFSHEGRRCPANCHP